MHEHRYSGVGNVLTRSYVDEKGNMILSPRAQNKLKILDRLHKKIKKKKKKKNPKNEKENWMICDVL